MSSMRKYLSGRDMQLHRDVGLERVGEDVVLRAQADQRLQARERADEAARVLGDLLDVVGDGVVVEQAPDGALAVLHLVATRRAMFSRVWLRLSTATANLVEVLAQLVAGRARPRCRPCRRAILTLSVISRMFSSDFLTSSAGLPAGHALDVERDRSMWWSSFSAAAELRSTPDLHALGDLLQRPLRQLAARRSRIVAQHRQRLVDLHQDVRRR